MDTNLISIFKSCELADIYGIAHILGVNLYKDENGFPKLRKDIENIMFEIQLSFDKLPKKERRATKRLLCQLRDHNKREMSKNGESIN